jgi:hypothetical protein
VRGINRDTALARWWQRDGRHIVERVKLRDDAFWLATKTGFIFGWIERGKRDAKAKRLARETEAAK